MPDQFNGHIALDVRASTPDWTPYNPPRAPDGAPNVLIVLYDDTGLAAWEPYGGRIRMPTMQRLAENGLTYTQWHTTSLCSPTRSCILTGRNHHQNGFACIVEGATGYPGSNAHLPRENGTIAQVLRANGYSTYWVGKDHNVPPEEDNPSGPKSNWPLQQGFDRFYGFLGGETNQWYPTLTEDNHAIEQPYRPEEGYHLSKDLADQALRMLRDSQSAAPSRPWFMWLCPGANHAPHHVDPEWADRYKGQFDDGYEAYREWVLARMVEKGIMPADTELTPLNPMPEGTFSPNDTVRPWDSLSDDEKRLFSRMAEVYAGFSEYTDHQVGRVVDYLEQSGQLENTLILYCADNGASGEGGPDGSVNENKFFNGWPDDIAENLAHLGDLGSPNTYNHYPSGWAAAFSTPFKMFKRYSYAGGTCDPLVIHWPKGIAARGEIRNQYHHVTDVVPTILDCCGVEMPDVVDGYEQVPLVGTSMRYTFDADGPTRRGGQYYCMLGTRGMWEDGWKVVAVHGPTSGIGNFDADRWELYHVDRGPLRGARPRRGAPRPRRAPRGPLVRGGREVRRAPARRPPPARDHRGRAAAGRAAARALRLLPRRRRGARVGGGQRPQPLVPPAGRGRPHEPRRRGGDLRPRLALRRPRACSCTTRSCTTSTTSSASRPSRPSCPGAWSRDGMSSAWSSRASRPASVASRTGPRGSTSTTRSSPKGRCARSPGSSRCAATACASAATRATR